MYETNTEFKSYVLPVDLGIVYQHKPSCRM